MFTVSTPDLTLRQKAYAFIQSKLLSGEMRAGDLVSEMALAEEIGISRTPVREAIGQLEIEGLLRKVPRVGTLVRLPQQREFAEMYGVREALESFVAAVAVNHLTGRQFAALENHQAALWELVSETDDERAEFLDAPKLARFFDADIGFHATIVGTTDNRHILKIIDEFRVVQRVFEYERMAYDVALVTASAREHGEILEALKSGDGARARNAMAFHVRSSCAHAMKFFEIAGANFSGAVPTSDENDGKTARLHPRLKQRPRRRGSALNSVAA